MRPDEQLGPKFLLYHDVLAAAGGDERKAREAFSRHIARIASLGYAFARMSDFLSGVRLGPRHAVITVDDGTRSFIRCMLPVLEEHGAVATLFILSGFAGKSGTRASFLSWEEVRELGGRDGVEFGSHGVSHVPLDQVDPDRMRREIEDGARAMRDQGVEPIAFAYPFGHFDEATKRAVADAGYSAAFSVYKGGNDRFEIRRRMFEGMEGGLHTRAFMSDRFFGVREALRRPVPSRWLAHEAPVSTDRWGPQHFGVKED